MRHARRSAAILAALPALPALVILATSLAGRAEAQVQRCQTASGTVLYTDRACADVGAVERLPQPGNATVGSEAAALHGCHRNLHELVVELTLAIDAHDTNRVAGLYHWTGMGTREGYAVMDRLDAIARQPLVDARVLYDTPAPDPAPTTIPAQADLASPGIAPDASPATVSTATPHPPDSAELMRLATPWRPSMAARVEAIVATPPRSPRTGLTVAAATNPPAARPVRHVPHAIQIEQTLANGTTPSRTVFGLRRQMGCWWLSL